MNSTFCFQVFMTAIFSIIGNTAFCAPMHMNIINKKAPLEEAWNLVTTEYTHNLKETTPARNAVYHLFEPKLIAFLFRKLLTRTHDWKEHMKNVADSFVTNYFNPENSSISSKFTKAGKEAAIQAPHVTSVSYKLGKKKYKRSPNKLNVQEEEIKKPFNFSPIVQFIPASLDLSNKIMFYQPQLVINGSVYIEQNKDPKSSLMQEMFNFNKNRNICTNA